MTTRKPRVVPTCFEASIGKRLIGWVETNYWAEGHRCEWFGAGDFGGGGRCRSLKDGVRFVLANDAARRAPSRKER